MPLVTSKQLLANAQKNGYAVGAFNVENMEMVQAVIAAAEEMRSPVIMQTTPSTVKYASTDYFYANVKAAADEAIGTAHGVYKGEPKLDLERLSQIREVVDIPLVLHGTSGVPDETVTECVKRGICKVNYATDLRIAFTKGVNEVLKAKPDTIDPKKYNAQGREEVKKYVMQKMQVVGSVGKA